MKQIKILFMSLITALSMSIMPVTVMAQSAADVCAGVNVANGGTCDTETANNQVNSILKTAILIFQVIVGVISTFVLITAGLNYINSGGDGSKTKTAKDRIMYACIGLMVVALSQVIVAFVLNRVDSASNI